MFGSSIWWMDVVTRAAITVGVIEYLKGFCGKILVPSWILRLALLIASGGAAVIAGGTIGEIITTGLAITAIAQVGYPVLVQFPSIAIENFKQRLGQ